MPRSRPVWCLRASPGAAHGFAFLGTPWYVPATARCQAARNAEVVVAFRGLDETLERTVRAWVNWPLEQIVFGACLVDDGTGFDGIRPCPLPSGCLLDVH